MKTEHYTSEQVAQLMHLDESQTIAEMTVDDGTLVITTEESAGTTISVSSESVTGK